LKKTSRICEVFAFFFGCLVINTYLCAKKKEKTGIIDENSIPRED
jgi:hypothetical protein